MINLKLAITSLLSLVACDDRHISFPIIIPGPQLDEDVGAWQRNITEQRISGVWKDLAINETNKEKQIWLNYESLNWTSTSYVQPQVHLWDKYLWDKEKNVYTVDKLLNDFKDRYGGIDSILLWPIYPNIGLDESNMFDRINALPGGFDGLKKLVDEFHSKDVKVLLGYTPWEELTRNNGLESNFTTRSENLLFRLSQCGFDGFNGDTLNYLSKDFFIDQYNPNNPMAIEPEQDAQQNSFWWSAMGWGYFTFGEAESPKPDFDVVPVVSLNKWLSYRGHHMVHITERWSHDRLGPMQISHFNGIGYESWENVWGIWNGFTPRAGEALRRASTLWRYLGKHHYTYDFKEWVPHTQDVGPREKLIFASKFTHENGNYVYMIVNRGDTDQRATVATNDTSRIFINLGNGKNYGHLTPDWQISISVEANGCAVILVVSELDQELQDLMTEMQNMTTGKPLSSFSNDWKVLEQSMVGMNSSSVANDDPKYMKLIPRNQKYFFSANGTEQEPIHDSNYTTKDMQFPWESQPQVNHQKEMDIGPFWMDVNLVTRQDFSNYLDETGYQAVDNHNYLRGWQRIQQSPTSIKYLYPKGTEYAPVTSITVDEAQAYCNHYGKRLPHSYEWQYAAQGTDQRIYPWGNEVEDPKEFTRVPTPCSRINNCTGINLFTPEDISKYSPQGDSPFGIRDMVGHVWQFTDQFVDEHTHHILLKGGSQYDLQNIGRWVDQDQWMHEQAGLWYFSTTYSVVKPFADWFTSATSASIYRVDLHNQWMSMSESFDRATTLGFRCVQDTPDSAPAPFHIHPEQEVFLQ